MVDVLRLRRAMAAAEAQAMVDTEVVRTEADIRPAVAVAAIPRAEAVIPPVEAAVTPPVVEAVILAATAKNWADSRLPRVSSCCK